jgi:hypothetical protein
MKEQGASQFCIYSAVPAPVLYNRRGDIIQRKNAFYKKEMLPKSAQAQQRTLEK